MPGTRRFVPTVFDSKKRHQRMILHRAAVSVFRTYWALSSKRCPMEIPAQLYRRILTLALLVCGPFPQAPPPRKLAVAEKSV
jgi:hypothetical protein